MHGNGGTAFSHLEERIAFLEGQLDLLVRGFSEEYVPAVVALRREVAALRARIDASSTAATNDAPLVPEDQRSTEGGV